MFCGMGSKRRGGGGRGKLQENGTFSVKINYTTIRRIYIFPHHQLNKEKINISYNIFFPSNMR